jgi:hypothetical protein
LPHRALEPIFSRGILLRAPQFVHLTIADVDSFIHLPYWSQKLSEVERFGVQRSGLKSP